MSSSVCLIVAKTRPSCLQTHIANRESFNTKKWKPIRRLLCEFLEKLVEPYCVSQFWENWEKSVLCGEVGRLMLLSVSRWWNIIWAGAKFTTLRDVTIWALVTLEWAQCAAELLLHMFSFTLKQIKQLPGTISIFLFPSFSYSVNSHFFFLRECSLTY